MCVDGIHRVATIYAIPSHLKPRNREKNLKPCTNSSGLTHFEVTALEATSGSLHGINFASALEAATVIKFESLTSENDNSFFLTFFLLQIQRKVLRIPCWHVQSVVAPLPHAIYEFSWGLVLVYGVQV